MGEQEIGWDKGDTKLVEDCILLYGRSNVNHQIWTGYFCNKGNHVSRRLECVSSELSCAVLSCHIALNALAVTEDNNDDSEYVNSINSHSKM
jgi:hypothetical protein